MARYGVSRIVVSDVLQGQLPLATIVANVLACCVLALVVFKWQHMLHSRPAFHAFLAIGFCGGFSTFSTFSLENYHLLKQGALLSASLNVLISVAACLLIFYIIADRS